MWSPRDKRQIRKMFVTLREATAWRQETQVAVRKQLARAPSQLTLAEAAEEWLVAASAGMVAGSLFPQPPIRPRGVFQREQQGTDRR